MFANVQIERLCCEAHEGRNGCGTRGRRNVKATSDYPRPYTFRLASITEKERRHWRGESKERERIYE